MEIYERIWELRKKYLKMSQADFGNHLGVNRDVINNIENNRLARPEQKLSLYKLICSEFNVNEDWLLNGNGPMFSESPTLDLEKFAKSKGTSDLELEIMKAYFELDPEIRHSVLDHFKQKLSATNSNSEEDVFTALSKIPDTPEELEKLYPPVDVSTKHKIG